MGGFRLLYPLPPPSDAELAHVAAQSADGSSDEAAATGDGAAAAGAAAADDDDGGGGADVGGVAAEAKRAKRVVARLAARRQLYEPSFARGDETTAVTDRFAVRFGFGFGVVSVPPAFDIERRLANAMASALCARGVGTGGGAFVVA